MRSELDTRVDARWLGLHAAMDSRDTVSRLVPVNAGARLPVAPKVDGVLRFFRGFF